VFKPAGPDEECYHIGSLVNGIVNPPIPAILGKCLIRVPKKLISTSKSVYVSVSNESII
jgi:hypothetical protein